MTPQLETGAAGLTIRWDDGTVGQFPFIWLRDTDPSGFHPDTGERAFDLTTIPLDIRAEDAAIEGGALRLRWPGADVESRFDLNWIKAHRPGQRRSDPAAVTPVRWRNSLGAEGIPRADAATLAASDDAFCEWLLDTKRYGVSIVTGLADELEAGLDVARRIGHLRETNFGLTFDVESKPDPNNLAYTADALPLHTDLTNQEMPPGYQFLHCLANEAVGGGSTFCDGAAVAEDLRAQNPEAFEVLSTVEVPFRFYDSVTDIRSRKTMIVLDDDGAVSEVCFNAHIADVLDIDPEAMVAFYRAYRELMALTRGPQYTIALKLCGGEMVVFDNRRVLHGREAFDPSTGRRRLRGAYVDRGEWDSRIRVISRG